MAYKFNPFTGKLDETGAGGGGGTPGGSDTQVQFNDGGTFGGDAGLTYNKTTDELTLAGDLNLDDGGAFSTTVQAVTPTANRTISFPDATGTVALVNGANGTIQYNDAGTLKGNSDFTVDPDWNDASTAFTGLKLNVTDTASAAGSNLLDLQVGGTSRFRIESGNQRVLANGYYIDTTIGYYLADGVNGSLGAGGFKGISTSSVSWVNSGNANSGTIDLALFRDDAGTLAQRNGTASQTFRLYNTWGNNGVDFERTSLTRDSSGLVIDAQKGGTGANPTNLLDVKLDGTSKLLLNNSGDVIPSRWLRLANSEVTIRGEGVYLASTSTIRFVNGSNTVGNTPDVGLARDSAGVLKITDGTTGTGYLRQEPIPVGDLPTAAPGNAGTRIFVSDSNVGAAGNFGAVVANGGSNVVPVYSDGGAWRIG
jgi:hypothetical protein